MNVVAYIGLGSNLASPAAQVTRAMAEIAALPDVFLLAASGLYQTAPYGFIDQPDFINAVVKIETTSAPLLLLAALQGIEAQHARTREVRWGPRTLDLDILLYGNAVVSLPQLQIPHPEMRQRDFVLHPLADIAPDLCFPDGVYLKDLLALQN